MHVYCIWYYNISLINIVASYNVGWLAKYWSSRQLRWLMYVMVFLSPSVNEKLIQTIATPSSGRSLKLVPKLRTGGYLHASSTLQALMAYQLVKNSDSLLY
jgi:hypothetical protein